GDPQSAGRRYRPLEAADRLRKWAHVRARREHATGRGPRLPAHAAERRAVRRGALARARAGRLLQPGLASALARRNTAPCGELRADGHYCPDRAALRPRVLAAELRRRLRRDLRPLDHRVDRAVVVPAPVFTNRLRRPGVPGPGLSSLRAPLQPTAAPRAFRSLPDACYPRAALCGGRCESRNRAAPVTRRRSHAAYPSRDQTRGASPSVSPRLQ